MRQSDQIQRINRRLENINYHRKCNGLERYCISTTVCSTWKILQRYKVYVFDPNLEEWKMPKEMTYICNTLADLDRWLGRELIYARKGLSLKEIYE